ncbi:uncharacterized protein PITG_12133 [Phytophthora infestans T30-4]|uniref:Tc1-like transposase DDE domain-containing protein n=1 Tax=Phytophthora infestans (strain T30-4) TaxID=403677 RepID=D0NJ43_PHYIT|nr:uncharacterized protein PITG_12133 [Phytophthora infestans T30-4]EEY59561.1 conserved hypothetical protein [Phytophthora infestans T30-4]|eukprot:XP_002900754.1 conserved hypothetical protein [Phytophthora infestans T30-4]
MVAGKKLTAAEKYLVVKTYEYIRGKKAASPQLWKGDVRDHVHEFCVGSKPSGRPRTFGESIQPLVRELVSELNSSGKPVAAPKLVKRLKEEHNINISVRSLRQSTANVAFRTQYLKKKISNLNRKEYPVRPEVYLDETFCNLNHTAQLSWVDKDKIWLEENEIWYDTSYTKAELMMLVRANKPKPIYRVTEIARPFGHLVYFTPPYHPELQPIELIWANIKGQIANNPASNMDELKNKINDGFASLTSSTWTKAYTHAQKYETRYMELADQYELVSEDEGDDQDSECAEDDEGSDSE